MSPERELRGAHGGREAWLSTGDFSLADIEAVRLLLRGDSSVDWHRLNFRTRAEVDQFLRVQLFDTDDTDDKRRIRVIHDRAIQYLRNHFALRIPDDLVRPRDIHELFLHASDPQRRLNRRKLLSCMLLKVMGIIHHLEARALVFRTPMSDADMFNLVHGRITDLREQLRRAGAPVLDIYGSRKSQDSLISKLLSKKETFAATVFDKFRYRIVTESQADVLPVAVHLLRTFLPFNYVLPGQSFNNLFDPRTELGERPDLLPEMDGILSNYRAEEPWGFRDRRSNEFSASTYRMISFIVDLPVRLDALLNRQEIVEHGRVGFALVEMQLVDARTEAVNDLGEGSHDAYKARRKERVLERLRWGGQLRAVRASRQAAHEKNVGEPRREGEER